MSFASGTYSGWYHNDDNDGGDTGANVGELTNVGEPAVGDSDMSDTSSSYEIPNPDPVIPVYTDVSSDSEMVNDDPNEDPEEDSDTDEDDVAKDPEFTLETYKVSRDKRDNVNF